MHRDTFYTSRRATEREGGMEGRKEMTEGGREGGRRGAGFRTMTVVDCLPFGVKARRVSIRRSQNCSSVSFLFFFFFSATFMFRSVTSVSWI